MERSSSRPFVLRLQETHVTGDGQFDWAQERSREIYCGGAGLPTLRFPTRC